MGEVIVRRKTRKITTESQASAFAKAVKNASIPLKTKD